MCGTGEQEGVSPVEALPASLEWRGEVLPLDPVDELSVLTVCDNTMDLLLPGQGPAKRISLADLSHPAWRPARARDGPARAHGR